MGQLTSQCHQEIRQEGHTSQKVEHLSPKLAQGRILRQHPNRNLLKCQQELRMLKLGCQACQLLLSSIVHLLDSAHLAQGHKMAVSQRWMEEGLEVNLEGHLGAY